MKSNATFTYALFLIIGDFLAVLAAFTVAYILRVKLDPRPLIEQIPARTYIQAFLSVLPLWILIHSFLGLYNPSIYERRFPEIGRLLMGSFIGILVVIGYDFVIKENLFPARLVPIYALGLGFSFLVLFRMVARIVRELMFFVGRGISNVLIIGDTAASEEFAEAIANSRHTGQKVLGLVTAKPSAFRTFLSFQGAIDEVNESVHGIIQTELYQDQNRNNEILRFAQAHHVAYRFVPGNSDLFVGNIDVELFAGRPVIAVHQTALIGWGRIAKRVFDIILTSVLMIIALPLMAGLALLVKLFDPKGPVFFKQTRLTRFNNEFRVFKFRTHRGSISGLSDKAAFAKLGQPELYEQYRQNGYMLEKDPRVSSFGRFLRRTSLDELPQLINVLKGDISLVGPRALIPEELNTYEKRHAILSVKSGMTGLAQISGREDLSFEERRKLDVYYVQNWSFWMDISILFKTIWAVLAGIGAK
jgi:exopolysaccharide biosynthesis polyprenyl glycosylphosphotransferase